MFSAAGPQNRSDIVGDLALGPKTGTREGGEKIKQCRHANNHRKGQIRACALGIALAAFLWAIVGKAEAVPRCHGFFAAAPLRSAPSARGDFSSLTIAIGQVKALGEFELRPARLDDEKFLVDLYMDKRVAEVDGEPNRQRQAVERGVSDSLRGSDIPGSNPEAQKTIFVKILAEVPSGRPVGFIKTALKQVRATGTVAEIAFAVDPEFWNNGLMKAALPPFLRALRVSAQAPRILRADVLLTNQASNRLFSGLRLGGLVFGRRLMPHIGIAEYSLVCPPLP